MREEECHFVEIARTSLDMRGPVYEFVAPDASFTSTAFELRPFFAGLRYMRCARVREQGVDEVRDPEDSELKDESVGAVLLLGVLEHVRFPGLVFQEIRRVLRRGGWAIVTTHMRQPIHGPVPDYWRFTPQGIETLCRNWFGSWRVWACGRPRFPRTIAAVATPSVVDDANLAKIDARMQAWESRWSTRTDRENGAEARN